MYGYTTRHEKEDKRGGCSYHVSQFPFSEETAMQLSAPQSMKMAETGYFQRRPSCLVTPPSMKTTFQRRKP